MHDFLTWTLVHRRVPYPLYFADCTSYYIYLIFQQLSKKEVEELLKKGAYAAVMNEENEGDKFSEEDIDTILQRRTQTVTVQAGVKGSTFAKASFNMSSNREDIDVNDPNFWQMWAKKANVDTEFNPEVS